MIPTLPELWYATVYVAAVVVAVLLWNLTVLPWRVRLRAANTYSSRHRKGRIPPLVHWMDDYRARITHWIVTHAQPVPEDFVPEAVVAALREPTQEMVVPAFGSTVTYGRGSGHYRDLRTASLDRDAERLIRSVTYAEIDDEMFAAVMAE